MLISCTLDYAHASPVEQVSTLQLPCELAPVTMAGHMMGQTEWGMHGDASYLAIGACHWSCQVDGDTIRSGCLQGKTVVKFAIMKS